MCAFDPEQPLPFRHRLTWVFLPRHSRNQESKCAGPVGGIVSRWPSLIDRRAGKIVGVLSCFDRVVIQRTIPSVCHAKAVETLLHARDIRMFDYGPLFADPFRQSVRAHVDRIAAEEGIEIEYIKKPKGYRKEDRIREIVARRGGHPGLVHIFIGDGAVLVVPTVA